MSDNPTRPRFFLKPRIRMSKALLILGISAVFSAPAQTKEALFEQGNEWYRTDQFEKAIVCYEQIEAMGFGSSELYFNLGNAYYKQSKIAPSIYNYERALKWNPQNKEAASNLEFAKRMAIDNIEVLPPTFFEKANAQFVQKRTFDQWAFLSVAFVFLMTIGFLGFYFSFRPAQKRTLFVGSILSACLFLMSLFFSFQEHRRSTTEVKAIVFAKKTEVLNAPSESGDLVFELHEGTKVLVLDRIGSWKKIKLADGKLGWISETALKEF